MDLNNQIVYLALHKTLGLSLVLIVCVTKGSMIMEKIKFVQVILVYLYFCKLVITHVKIVKDNTTMIALNVEIPISAPSLI